MELVLRKKCPICDSLNHKSIYSLPYKDKRIQNFLELYYNNKLPLNLVLEHNYNLLECNKCKLIFQQFIPDKEFSIKLYENYISSQESLKKKEEKLSNFTKRYQNEIKLIKEIFKNKKFSVLEFGAGWGFWSSEAKKLGLDVSCLELSQIRINYMKQKGLNVIQNLNKENKKFYFIYSDQTFEHVSNPKEILNLMNLNLNVGGYILLNFPSSLGIKKKLKKNYIPKKDAVHPLEHLNLFNRTCINTLLKKTNLKLINFKSFNSFKIKSFLKDVKNLIYFESILLKKIS